MPRRSFHSAAAVMLAVACLWSPLCAHPHTLPKYQLADQAAPGNRAEPPGAKDTCRLLVLLVDAQTRVPLPGLLRMTLPGGAAINVPELYNRGEGLGADHASKAWHVVLGLKIQEPGWVALRVQCQAKNELDGPLFAHTSPIYVDVAGKRIFQASAAAALIDDMQRAIEEIIRQARFSNDAEQNSVLKIYRDGIAALREQMQNQP